MAAKKDFFISYNKADKAWAEWIAWQLEAAGYTIIIQAWDFKPGSNWVLQMDKAIKQAHRIMPVLSSFFLEALYTQPEWAAGFALDPTGEKRILIPVRVGPCDLDGLLAQIVYVDLVELNEPDAKHALLNGIKDPLRPDKPVPFPGSAATPKGPAPRFPETSAAIWNVPHPHNPRFIGRKELLTGVKKTLRRKGKSLKIAVLYGLGGVGKTQIALQYVYDRQKDYSVIWWLRAGEPATLALDYAKLGEELQLPFDSTSPELVPAVKRWLTKNQGWLLVFDNAEKPEDLGEYLPQGNGAAIITSRNPNWRSLAEPMKVQELPRDEAADFLVKRTGDPDQEAARELAKELGCLPLALEQAGAYVEACGSNCARYLELFRVRHQEVLESAKPATDYPDTVATTWKLSFESLRKECPAAADLMELCAFFAPEAIPFDIFTDHPEHLPGSLKTAVNDPLEWDEAIAGLKRYSLAEVGQDYLSFHRLVQMVVRQEMDQLAPKGWLAATHRLIQMVLRRKLKPAARKRQVAAAVSLIDEAYTFDEHDLQKWPRAAQVLPHGLAVVEHSSNEQADDETTARLLNDMGLHLDMLGQFSGAKSLLERALSISKTVFGPNHPKVATNLNNLGGVLQELGDLEGARANLERALKIDEKVYGPDHPTVAIRLNNLGGVLQALGDLRGAEANFERALKIDEKVYGPDHSAVARELNNLGGVLRDLRDLEGAKANYERALKIGEKVFGSDHPRVATVLNNLGMVLQDLGDWEGDKVNCERALKIDEKVYGPDHPAVARALNNLGVVLKDLGDVKGARANFERALRIFQVSLGEGHPSTKITLKNLKSLESD